MHFSKLAFILFLSPLYNHEPCCFDTTFFLYIVINKGLYSIIQANCLIWFCKVSTSTIYTYIEVLEKSTKCNSNFYQQQLDLFLLLCSILTWMQSFLLYLFLPETVTLNFYKKRTQAQLKMAHVYANNMVQKRKEFLQDKVIHTCWTKN